MVFYVDYFVYYVDGLLAGCSRGLSVSFFLIHISSYFKDVGQIELGPHFDLITFL